MQRWLPVRSESGYFQFLIISHWPNLTQAFRSGYTYGRRFLLRSFAILGVGSELCLLWLQLRLRASYWLRLWLVGVRHIGLWNCFDATVLVKITRGFLNALKCYGRPGVINKRRW